MERFTVIVNRVEQVAVQIDAPDEETARRAALREAEVENLATIVSEEGEDEWEEVEDVFPHGDADGDSDCVATIEEPTDVR